MKYFFIFLLFFNFKSFANENDKNNIENWSLLKNFKIEIENSGFVLPTAMSFVKKNNGNAEDVNYYILELGGTLKAVLNNKKIITYFDNFIPNKRKDQMDQSGAAGMCLDQINNNIFVTYAYNDQDSGEKRNAFIKFENDNYFQTKPSNFTLFENLFLNEKSHSAHQIGPCIVDEKYLYLAIGYGLDRSEAQNINSTLGSVIRLDKETLLPPIDNPFYIDDNKLTAQDYIWAYGFRNIFGLFKVNEKIYFTQNGGNIDSFGIIERGKNYLWDGTDNGIATNSEFVFYPSQGLVSLTYIDDNSQLPNRFKNKFYIISTGATGVIGPGEKGKNVWILNYDINKKTMNNPPEEFLKYKGKSLQLPLEIENKDDSFYFFGIMPENSDYTTNIYKISYLKNFEHSSIIDEETFLEEGLLDVNSQSFYERITSILRYRHLLVFLLLGIASGSLFYFIYIRVIKRSK